MLSKQQAFSFILLFLTTGALPGGADNALSFCPVSWYNGANALTGKRGQ
jgi:hypothetical protein